jgi:serine/threonine-protein kinase
VPKISDFGLAKRLEEKAGQTRTGDILGSPSYISPEQAAGDRKRIGPAADVYALGAILYECLTGRPPFKAAATLDTLQQVLTAEPVPPSRLNAEVPRDLETICLKCLHKEPHRRYASAAALADDLGRYREGRLILVRPVGRLERTWRWCRRNPKDAALIGAGLLAVALGAIAYLWLDGARQAAEQDRRDRQARATSEAERNLAEAELLWERAKSAPVSDLFPWEQACSAARHAREVIDANSVDEPTRQRVEQTLIALSAARQEAEHRAATVREDERMKAALERLAYRQAQVTTGHGDFAWSLPGDDDYTQAFRSYHDIDLNRLEEAEARIRASAIKAQLLTALDAWIPLRPDLQGRRRLADLANRLSEPDEFRRALREALVEKDRGRLRQLAQRDLSTLAPQVIFDVAIALGNSEAFEEAVALLRPAQQRYPAHFGINFELAVCLGNLRPPRFDEQVRFYTAATALQPGNSTVHNNLGCALQQQGMPGEAIAEYRTALRCQPDNGGAHYNLGSVLWQQGQRDEALAEFRTALRLNPNNAYAMLGLGNGLYEQGKLDEAVAWYQSALRLKPRDAYLRNNLGSALWQQGKLDEAVAEFRTALRWSPQHVSAQYNLGGAFLARGAFKEGRAAYLQARELLAPSDPRRKIFEDDIQRAERLEVLGRQLDDIVQGRKRPVNAEEGATYAVVCMYGQHPAAAARLFRDAFVAAPGLVEDNRLEAAQVAARAGVGQGEDATSVTEEQRAVWRAQARDWLRAEFEAQAIQAVGNKAERRQAAARQLRLWQSHLDFAGLRDEAELKKLPQDEQTVWRQFWADVAAAADRAEKR